jgi:heptosyltransferase II
MAKLGAILVFHKGGIGDVVFGLPLLFDLKAAYPSAHLTVLTHAQGRDVLAFCPAVDEVISSGEMLARWTVGGARAALGQRRFDLAVATARSLRAAWLLRGLGSPRRVGFGGGPEALLYTHVAPVRPFEVVFARRFERLAACLGLLPVEARPQLVVPPTALAAAHERLRAAGWSANGPLIALHAGGGWPTKQWPVEHLCRFAVLARKRLGAQVLLQGGRADEARAEAVRREVGDAVIPMVGNPVSEALAEMAACAGVVGLDSGLSHAAVALGIPSVLLFGPSDPRSVVPASHQQLLFRAELECRPCNRRGKTGCPEGHHRCMRALAPEDVLSTLEPLVRPPADSRAAALQVPPGRVSPRRSQWDSAKTPET